MRRVILFLAGIALLLFSVPVKARTELSYPRLNREPRSLALPSPEQTQQLSFVEGEVLVKFRPDKINLAKQGDLGIVASTIRVLGVSEKAKLNPENIILFKSWTKTTAQLISEFRSNPLVGYAEPNYLVYTNTVPNDIDFVNGPL